jgi:hypothetical protein
LLAVGSVEDRAQQRGHDPLLVIAHMLERFAEEVNTSALPRGSRAPG